MGTVARLRTAFRNWRRSRPFWAGVWTLLAGLEILSIPLAPLALMMHEGIAGVSGALMGVFMVILGLTMWLSPGHRVFAGIATLIFAVASIVLSNFGGFLIGFLLGAIGGAMAIAWVPDGPPPHEQPVPDWSGGDSGGEPDKEEPEKKEKPAKPAKPEKKKAGKAGKTVPANGEASFVASFTVRGMRMRAIGALPAGGALLAGGLQPMAPYPMAMAALPTIAPAHRPDRLSVCSLLDGLLGARGQSKPHKDGPHAAVDAAAGLRGKLDAAVPGQRTRGPARHARSAPLAPSPAVPGAPAQAQAPAAPAPGGLLGAVTGLLGLTPPPASASAPAPTPSVPAPAPGAAPAPAPRHAAPGPGRPHHDTVRGTGTGTTLAVGPLRLALPRLPADGGMDSLLGPLPLDITVGDPKEHQDSPWCLPKVSLSLSGAAARFREPAAAQPFRIRTPLLVLTGLTYHGITSVSTHLGPQKVLVFTAYRLDIAGLRQTAPLLPPTCTRALPDTSHPPFYGLPGVAITPLGIGLPGIGFVPSSAPGPGAACQGKLEQDAAPASTTTATGRPVVLLTKVLSGNLLGLLPVTFTPDMPPPLPPGLTIPIPLFFTHVLGFNQFLGADRLSVPGLAQSASF